VTSVTYRLLPDFDYVKNNSDSNVEFAHRKVKSGDIYFLDNRTNHDESIDATFRVAGLQPKFCAQKRAQLPPHHSRLLKGALPYHFTLKHGAPYLWSSANPHRRLRTFSRQ
jgi:glycosyl hydrolase family 106( putative alpha-L-rhamnosidase)